VVCLASYPISLVNSTDYPIFHFSTMFWPSLVFFVAVNVLIAFLACSRTMCFLSSLSLTNLVFLQTFLYPIVAGPDTSFFDGVVRAISASSNASPAFASYPWPVSFIMNDVLASTLHVSVEQAGLVQMIVLGVLMCLVLSIYCSRFTDDRLSVLVPVLYFYGFIAFVNWQLAPQTFALVILALCLILVYPNRYSSDKWIVPVVLILVLTLSHPFFWVFPLVGVPLNILYSKWRKKGDTNTHKTWVPITLVLMAFGIAYDVFFVPEFVAELKSLSEIPLVTGLTQLFSILQSHAGVGHPVVLNPNYVLLATISDLFQVAIIAFCGIALLLITYKKGLRSEDFIILFATLAVFVGGGILGYAWRAIQVGAILAVGSVAYSLNYRRLRPIALVLIAVV
jgi:hypothetical protein